MNADFPKHRLEAATFPLDARLQINADDVVTSASASIRRGVGDSYEDASGEFTPTVQWDAASRTLYVTVQEAESGDQASGVYEIFATAQRNGEPWVFLTRDVRSGAWRLPNFFVVTAGDPDAP